ncbi:cadherin-23-like [Patiria miniata]|uniref:Cadherin domain-containing protein n=1 Tax=Patiria miniata TaxID=46514 RepID=A0A914ABW1_PATMI|nr:cadherin-23-like [Patiria miniata]
MAAVWLMQLSLVLLVSKFATGTPPSFLCEDENADYGNNCDMIGNYHDMNGFDIAETNEVNKLLYTLKAVDPDDENSPVTFEILPYTGTLLPDQANGFDYLNVGSSTGEVTTKTELDYETVHRLYFKWKLTDQDGEMFTTTVFTVGITDINDNDPEFTSSSYRLEAIQEGSKTPDDILVTANATDRDTGDDIKYDIVDSHLGWPCNGDIFKIDPSTGGISLKAGETLDFETSTLYTVCVRANDSGAPVGEPRYAYAQVIISIQDVQDEPPYFTKTNYDQEIPEDTPEGSDVLEVLAREGDRGVLVPNLILYSLTGGDGKFEIGNSTGQITIKELLDRETKTSYIVTVVAQEIHADGTLQAPPSSAEVNITIQVGDVDDKNATFTANVVDISLSENTLEGSFVSLDGLAVQDVDQAPNNLFYLHLGGPDADAFVIPNEDEAIRGDATVDVRVSNEKKLDFEANKFLEFEIYATDALGNQYDVAYVHVNITDQNDETPTFDRSEYSFTVEENSRGTVVGFVNATDRDSEAYSQVTYQLFGQGDNPQFEMNSTTGEIRTRNDSNLNYERQSVYFFTCVATDGQRSGTAIVQIELLDQNDNAPQFSATSYTTQVDENTIPSGPLLTVSASDADPSTDNNEITYTLWNDTYSDRFTIKTTDAGGVIRLQQTLDFEEDGSEIEIIVIATDTGEPQLSANATVKVRIQDMNDQSPIFTEEVYYGEVSEGAPRGELVLRVNATDADQENNVNSRIDYFFSDQTVSDFRIVIGTGEVRVNSGNLDRDEKGSYYMEVIAIDRGEPTNSGTCYVNITVLDINNKAPYFPEEDPTVGIYENATSGSLVAMVTATDLDETALLSYGVDLDNSAVYDEDGEEVPTTVDQFFWVENTTGDVYTTDTPLDRETTARFEITITVEDLAAFGSTPQTAEVLLTINVQDINDNAPVFSESGYEFNVDENTDVGSIISNVISATDKDQGKNGEIRYELADNVDSLLRIDPDTGILFVNGTFDREKYPNYTAIVVAFDKGSPELSSNETIVITITDVNDNGPKFESQDYTAEISEDFPNGTTILQVVANDKDESMQFGTVEYQIAAGNPDGIFTIGETDGIIMIEDGEKLDRETEDTHILTITASDGEKQDSVEVTITVLDVNDEVPKFATHSDTINLQESVEPGNLVIALSAVDKDQLDTNNSRVQYFIDGGNEEGLFKIDSLEGDILTQKELSNRVGAYRLRVVARDMGTPPLQSETLITVIVTDVNDDTPEIISPINLEVFYIPENYTGFVLEVEAKDTDIGPNGDVTFRFIQSAGETGKDDQYFDMVSAGNDTATISIHTKTDRETKDTYYLTVEVKDNGIAPLAATVSFTVQVNDTDDNEPIFWTDSENKPKADFTVSENDDSAVIGSVDLASDADEPQNQHIYYFIVDGNAEDQANGAFVLDNTTGVLSLQKPLDREQNETLQLVVKVTSDMDFSPAAPIPYDDKDNTLLEVTVTVKDTNDNGPVFYIKDKLYTGGVKDDAVFNSEVIKVEAVDKDLGDFAVVVYTITSQKYTSTDGKERDDNAFGIIKDTGSVITDKVFQKGDAGFYTIIVKAEDSLNSDFSDSATVSIYLYSEDQQIEMTIFKSAEEVRGYQDDFKQTIEEIILKYGDFSSSQSVKRASTTFTPVIVIDDIQIRVVNGQPQPGWSVMQLHAVNTEDNTIIAPQLVVNAIDDAYDYTEIIRGVYGVDEIVIAIPPTEAPPDLTWIQWLLVGILCAIVVIAFGLVATICIMTSRYKRKLRAATAGIYEPINPAANANHAPNTNKFTEPGSNPLYNSKLSDEYEKRYSQSPESAEAAEEDTKNEKISNGHAKKIPPDSKSVEEQEMVVDMFDDSQDYQEVGDNETGDLLLLQVLADYDKDREDGLVNLPEFANMTITEI